MIAVKCNHSQVYLIVFTNHRRLLHTLSMCKKLFGMHFDRDCKGVTEIVAAHLIEHFTGENTAQFELCYK